MRAILLAAGQGSRLRPFTDDRPKCLVELGGHPLLQWQLDSLDGAGIDEVSIVAGYRHDQIKIDGARMHVNRRWANTNMVESLRCAAADLHDDVLIAYTDIVYRSRIVENAIACTSDIGVIVDRDWRALWERRMDDPLADAESLRLSEDGRHILEIGQPVTSLDEIQAQYIGMIRLSAHGCEILHQTLEDGLLRRDDPFGCGRDFDHAYLTDLLMHLVRLGLPVAAIPIDGGWTEVDSPEDLRVAEAMLSEGVFGLPTTLMVHS